MHRIDHSGPRLAGIVLILVGSLFLLNSLFSLTFWLAGHFLWPLILIGLGIAFLERQYQDYRLTARIPFPWPLLLLFGGISGLLKAFGVYTVSLFSWPVILIVIGLWMLATRR